MTAQPRCSQTRCSQSTRQQAAWDFPLAGLWGCTACQDSLPNDQQTSACSHQAALGVAMQSALATAL